MSDIEKSLASVSTELKGIKNILSAMWHSRYNDGTTDRVSPEFLADEYISTEECAKRLGLTYYKGEEASLRTFDSVDGPVVYDDVDRSHWDNVPSMNKNNA